MLGNCRGVELHMSASQGEKVVDNGFECEVCLLSRVGSVRVKRQCLVWIQASKIRERKP